MLPGFPVRRPAPEADLPLEALSLVVLDFETTGLYPYRGDEIIELGALYVEGLEVRTEPAFDRMVNPGRPISESALRVHGIPDSALADQPRIEAVLPEFLAFLGDRCLVGQNVAFDLSFLVRAMDRCGLPRLKNPILDTKWLSRLAFPNVAHHSLDFIAQRLEIERPQDRHRALGDALFTARILVELLRRCQQLGHRTVGDLLEAYERAEGGAFGSGNVLEALEHCFQERRVVELDYASPPNGESGDKKTDRARRVSIYFLSPPYLLGFCHTRHSIRTFRIDRVADARPLEDHYGIPDDFHPEDHFLRR